MQGPRGPSGQTINLTVDPLQFPGIVAQDFDAIFSDAEKNRTHLIVSGPSVFLGFEAVVINGPGVEIQVVPGFDAAGNPRDHAGLAQELPFVFETADTAAITALDNLLLQSTIPAVQFESFTPSPSLGSGSDIMYQLTDFIPHGPTPSAPGLEGRTRYTFGSAHAADHDLQITRNPPAFLAEQGLNPATDLGVFPTGSSIHTGAYPAVTVGSGSLLAARRLTLVYDFAEAGDLFAYVGQVVHAGTTTGLKTDLEVLQDPPFGSDRRLWRGCFPVKYELFTGFVQDIQLKERVVMQCDIPPGP